MWIADMIIHLSPILENGLIYLIFNSNLFISLIYLAYSSCIRQTDGWRWSMYSVAQSCPTRCDPMDCGTPGSSVHGISLVRILEWIAIFFSGGSSWHRDCTCISCVSCISRPVLYHQCYCGSQVVEEMAIYLPEMGTVSSQGDLGEAGPVSQREYHL